MITSLLLITATAQAAPPTPTDSQQAMYVALRVRHDPPSCAFLAAMSADPVADLAWLVDNATQPAWAGMRAATCLLVDHPVASQPHFEGWLSTEGHKGLAILMTQRVDELPLPVATALTHAALGGPDQADIRPRLASCAVPEVRALASQ